MKLQPTASPLTKSYLIEFTCAHCQKSLLWAPPTAKVQCNKCHRWITAKNLKFPNPCKLSNIYTPEEEQLELFV